MKAIKKPKISVVILNYNGIKDTLSCINSLLYGVFPSVFLNLILVDNQSFENPEKKISESFEIYSRQHPKNNKKLIYIQNPKNLGFAEGNNIGIKKALSLKSDYILLLNNDTVVDTGLFKTLLKTAKEKQWDIIGPKIYFYPGCEFHYDRYKQSELGKVVWYFGGKIDWKNMIFSHSGVDEIDRGQFKKDHETDYVSGCAMFVRAGVFKKIGFLDKRYFMYLEDMDFCQRAKLSGFHIGVSAKAVVWHKNASSSGKPGSEFHVYYQTRNRLIFAFKYAGWKMRLLLLRESLRQFFLNDIRRKAVLDFYLHNFGGRTI